MTARPPFCRQAAIGSSENPFDLAHPEAYRRWRDVKLHAHPRSVDELVVEIGDTHRLTEPQRHAILDRCGRCNMALYAGKWGDHPDKSIPRNLARQLGLVHLDRNPLADDDGITPLAVAEEGERCGFIPYTDRPIRWHTDGYYNAPEQPIRALVLHCVSPAAEGGENRLLDHELAYILLREENPDFIHALMQRDAMTIPARVDEEGVARPARSGPVFSVDRQTARLHMRYTARTHSIVWKQDPMTLAAVAALKRLLDGGSPFIFRARLEAGMGLVCNNVLHERAAFADSGERRRLLYRARYYERVIDACADVDSQRS